jgi:hypothetical protein
MGGGRRRPDDATDFCRRNGRHRERDCGGNRSQLRDPVR